MAQHGPPHSGVRGKSLLTSNPTAHLWILMNLVGEELQGSLIFEHHHDRW